MAGRFPRPTTGPTAIERMFDTSSRSAVQGPRQVGNRTLVTEGAPVETQYEAPRAVV